MKGALFVLLGAVLLSGCVSSGPTPESIQGTWQFAYISKMHSRFGQMPPPRFDIITFRAPNIVNLTCTLTGQDFNGTFTMSGSHLSYEFLAPGIDRPITHDLTVAVAEDGKALLLTHDRIQMVYYPPSHFFANDLAGEWTTGSGKQAETMRLGTDGSYRLLKSGVVGHYSLWPSPYGKTMTTVFAVPAHGGFLVLWKGELYEDELTLTPITWSGLQVEDATTWTRRRPRAKRPRPAAPAQ